jgi:3-oxoacyl-[acyl-carrier-protein] synthase-1
VPGASVTDLQTTGHRKPLGIAGAALVHAGGHGTRSLWSAVARAESSLRFNDLGWCDLPCWIGAVPGVDEAELPASLRQWDCRVHRLTWMALQDEEFRKNVDAAIARHGAHRIGVVLGTSTSGIRSTEVAYEKRRESGKWPTDLHYRYTHSADSLSRFTAQVLGIHGPMVVITTACSSSAKVFLTAQRWIESNLVDAAIVGGADSLCLSTLHGFDALQLLSTEICRPFDIARNGISIGEAAGFALIHREPAPLQFLGGGESSDAWHMSTPHPEGLGAQEAMRQALAAAGLGATDIGYINAHGTGTLANDRAEAAAVNGVFGALGVPVSSTKGVTGHTLGAAGITEAIVTLHALEDQRLPVSANVGTPDPSLSLDIIVQPRSDGFRYAMSNSFGFGGSNCALIFGRSD